MRNLTDTEKDKYIEEMAELVTKFQSASSTDKRRYNQQYKAIIKEIEDRETRALANDLATAANIRAVSLYMEKTA
jgi:endonuclease III